MMHCCLLVVMVVSLSTITTSKRTKRYNTQACQDPCYAVGLDDLDIIPDTSFEASSELRDEYGAREARFSSGRCWQPNGNSNPADYLQIDLGKLFVICAVATKGSAKPNITEWTTEYKISTSSDGDLWITYSDDNNSPKLFPGNTDKNTAVKNDLTIPDLAKLIRFTPTQYNIYKALRVEVYGIDVQDFSCKSLPIGIASVSKIPANRMTSSSQYNASTPPSNGRLGYTAGSSWCAATSDSSPYLQVDFGSPYIICGVATQGDHNSDQWVQTYQIQTSTDGSSFTDYKHNNGIKDVSGNTDSDTIVKHMFFKGTVSQYIRINAKSDYGNTSCMRTELYGIQQNTVCTKMSVGVPYSIVIPDHRFTASSYFIYENNKKPNRYIPSNARLRLSKAWKPKTKNVGDWLQIDLGSVMYVCAVATQGNPYLDADDYAKKYKLRISLDNVNWTYYQENNTDKVFTGNKNRTTIVTNTLDVPTKTKFLRFYPTEFENFAAMRVDVYGVPETCRSPFGVEEGTGLVKNNQMTSSSQLDSSHAASFGRLYGERASWCSNTLSKTEYIQIDLGKVVKLTGIATQGDHTMDKWVKTYILEYSIDGSAWNVYRGDQHSAKVFQGNSDRTSIVVRWLSHPVTVRYVQVLPQSWNNAICMRVELFGCTRQHQSPLSLSQIETIRSRSVMVRWTHSSTKNIYQYQACILRHVIKYWNNGTTKTISVSSLVNSHTIRGLSVCTSYSVQVKVVSNVGELPWSNIKTFTTDLEVPTVIPGDVQAVAKTSHSILVTWQVPDGIICAPSKYKVIYSKTSGGRSQEVIVKGGHSTSQTLTNLDKFTEYTITVKFGNDKGYGPASSAAVKSTLKDSNPKVSSSTTVIGVALGSGVLVLIFLALLFVFIKRRKQRKEWVSVIENPWEVNFNQIELLDELGEGGFGKVWKGQMDRNALAIIEAHPTETSSNKDKQGSNNSMIVAVKMLHEVASAQEQSEFLREIEFMKTVGFHKNIIAMVACCTKQEDQLSLVVEFAKHGDLLNLLKDKRNKTYIKCRRSSTNEPSTSNSSNSDVGYDTKQSLESLLEELIAFSWQIAQGMEYLSSKGIVHRDLAARNILVADGFIAKVADFGFSRQVNYQDKLYQAHGPRRLPLRWTSPEAIEYQIFTSESDVWSFGVVLWEIYSIGKLPYPSLYIDKLLRFIKKGNRMEKPDLCPDDMYKVMRICWNEHAEERPSFSAIIKTIEALMTKDTPYVEMIEMGEDEDGYTIPFDISDVESDVSDMV